MATTYFGYCDPDTGAPSGIVTCNTGQEIDWITAGYACPGTGSQNVITLGVYHESGSAVNVNLAIYAGTTLIAYGTSKKTAVITQSWTSWSNAELTWVVGTTLTGGTTYKLVLASASNSSPGGTTGLASGTSKYQGGDYTDTPASPLPAGTNYTHEISIRCGVEPAAGGGGADTAKKRMSATHLLVPSFPMAILPD